MTEEQSSGRHPTLALNTKVEEEFVTPLTAVRGALEILRDYPDLSEAERRNFVESALLECARLERGVQDLASTVYAAAQQAELKPSGDLSSEEAREYGRRIAILDDIQTIEIDFSDFEFSSANVVNAFYDVIDQAVESSKRHWYFLVNYRDCRVWPEAWVSFAHRGKKVNVGYSLGTVRYIEEGGTEQSESQRLDPDMFASRSAALARIEELRHERGGPAKAASR